MGKKQLIKNHSEYFVTNPGVRDIVETNQKSYRNQAQKLVQHQGIFTKKNSMRSSPPKNSNLYKLT